MEPPYLRKLRKQYELSQQTELFPEHQQTPAETTNYVQPVAQENLREELQRNDLLYDAFRRTIGDRIDYSVKKTTRPNQAVSQDLSQILLQHASE